MIYVRDIIDICNKISIPISGSVFKRSPDELNEILDICNEYGIGYAPSLLKKDSKSLRDSIDYVLSTYGNSFLLPLVVSKSRSYLEEVLPYIESRGELEVLKTSASILSLNFDEIKEREAFIFRIGESNSSGGRFNSVYGLSKKRFSEKVNSYKNGTGIKR